MKYQALVVCSSCEDAGERCCFPIGQLRLFEERPVCHDCYLEYPHARDDGEDICVPWKELPEIDFENLEP